MKFSRPMADFVKGRCLTADNGNALANAGRLNLMDLGSGAGDKRIHYVPEQDRSGTYLAFPAAARDLVA